MHTQCTPLVTRERVFEQERIHGYLIVLKAGPLHDR